MKIAILGGSFDPPHKNISGEVSNEDRLNMLKLSIESDERFLLDEYELNNDGVSYTINTLNYLYKNYDIEGKIGLIIGADLIKDFDKWREPEKIAEISNITVVNREDDKNLYKENIDKYNIKVIMAPRIDISSSLIRNRIKEKKGFRYFVKEKVYDYIVSKKLYL